MQNQADAHQAQNMMESLHVDFMDIVFDLHQQDSDSKKKNKAKRKSDARRAIEMHQEKKQLQADIQEWWEGI